MKQGVVVLMIFFYRYDGRKCSNTLERLPVRDQIDQPTKYLMIDAQYEKFANEIVVGFFDKQMARSSLREDD